MSHELENPVSVLHSLLLAYHFNLNSLLYYKGLKDAVYLFLFLFKYKRLNMCAKLVKLLLKVDKGGRTASHFLKKKKTQGEDSNSQKPSIQLLSYLLIHPFPCVFATSLGF